MSRMIIADDNRTLATGLKRFFSKKGIEVETVHDGEELLALFRERPADILLLDLKMPKLDGLSAAKHIRASSPQTRIIIITGYGDSDALETATNLGVSDFLTKPFGLGEISGAVERALRGESSLEPEAKKIKS